MTPATNHRPARKVRTPDGATAHLPAVDLLDAATAAPFWCDCNRRVEALTPHIVVRRVGDADGVFDVRWCSRDCRAKHLGGAA
jgi:hypothetical protein